MSIVLIKGHQGIYHYPPDPEKANDGTVVTLCGIKAKKEDKAQFADFISSDMQPCDECSSIDEHRQHFVGRVM